MNKKRSLILLVSVIVLFGIGYLALTLWQNRPEEEKGISLPVSGDIERLEILCGADSTVFVKEDGEWTLEGDEGFPLKPRSVEAMCKTVASLTAVRKSDGGNIEDYGFDEPSCRINTLGAGGEKHSYIIGAYNAYADQYYLSADGENYMLASSDAEGLFVSAYDFIEADAAPDIDEDSITAFAVRSDSGKWYYVLEKTQDGYAAHGSLVDSTDESAVKKLDADSTLEMLTRFTRLYFYDCVEYKATDAETLSQYGLDSPVAAAQVRYTDKDGDEQSHTLYFGSQTGGYIYVRMEGSDMIFTAYTNEAKLFLSPDFGSMTVK